MWEQSKAIKRRFNIGLFHSRYFVGNGVDIGGKPDPLGQYAEIFPKMRKVKTWDLEDGDAQYMESEIDDRYDFVSSSHCLEHMVDVKTALKNWIRVTKKGGFLIITIPDEDLYEQQQWPSRYNADHKWTFTIGKKESWSPKSINLLELLMDFSDQVEVEKIELIRDFFRESLAAQKLDQTKTPVAECCIEFILRKR
jgi:SAM-dependent methyltransferase